MQTSAQTPTYPGGAQTNPPPGLSGFWLPQQSALGAAAGGGSLSLGLGDISTTGFNINSPGPRGGSTVGGEHVEIGAVSLQQQQSTEAAVSGGSFNQGPTSSAQLPFIPQTLPFQSSPTSPPSSSSEEEDSKLPDWLVGWKSPWSRPPQQQPEQTAAVAATPVYQGPPTTIPGPQEQSQPPVYGAPTPGSGPALQQSSSQVPPNPASVLGLAQLPLPQTLPFQSSPTSPGEGAEDGDFEMLDRSAEERDDEPRQIQQQSASAVDRGLPTPTEQSQPPVYGGPIPESGPAQQQPSPLDPPGPAFTLGQAQPPLPETPQFQSPPTSPPSSSREGSEDGDSDIPDRFAGEGSSGSRPPPRSLSEGSEDEGEDIPVHGPLQEPNENSGETLPTTASISGPRGQRQQQQQQQQQQLWGSQTLPGSFPTSPSPFSPESPPPRSLWSDESEDDEGLEASTDKTYSSNPVSPQPQERSQSPMRGEPERGRAQKSSKQRLSPRSPPLLARWTPQTRRFGLAMLAAQSPSGTGEDTDTDTERLTRFSRWMDDAEADCEDVVEDEGGMPQSLSLPTNVLTLSPALGGGEEGEAGGAGAGGAGVVGGLVFPARHPRLRPAAGPGPAQIPPEELEAPARLPADEPEARLPAVGAPQEQSWWQQGIGARLQDVLDSSMETFRGRQETADEQSESGSSDPSDPELMYPFQHLELEGLHRKDGSSSEYKPNRYFGPPMGDTDRQRIELLKYHDADDDALDARPVPPPSPDDPARAPMSAQVGDHNWGVLINRELSQESWGYIEGLSERVREERRGRAIDCAMQAQAPPDSTIVIDPKGAMHCGGGVEDHEDEAPEEAVREEAPAQGGVAVREDGEGREGPEADEPAKFCLVPDASGERRWVAVDEGVVVGGGIRCVDGCSYSPSRGRPPEHADPRDQYTQDYRPCGGAYACDGEGACECFRRDLDTPKAGLFNTSDGRGIGLRALREIRVGDCLGEFRGTITVRDNSNEADMQADRATDKSYVVGGHWADDTDFGPDKAGNPRSFSYQIDARMAGNETRFINHHCDPDVVNCDYFRERHQGRMFVAVKATRDIRRGQEILLDYGSMDDWTPAGGGFCRCGSPEKCRHLERHRRDASGTYRVEICGEDGSDPENVLIEHDGTVRLGGPRPAAAGPAVVATKPRHTVSSTGERGANWLLRTVRAAADSLGFRTSGHDGWAVRTVHLPPPDTADTAGQLASVTAASRGSNQVQRWIR